MRLKWFVIYTMRVKCVNTKLPKQNYVTNLFHSRVSNYNNPVQT